MKNFNEPQIHIAKLTGLGSLVIRIPSCFLGLELYMEYKNKFSYYYSKVHHGQIYLGYAFRK